MTAYVIADIQVTDPATHEPYRPRTRRRRAADTGPKNISVS